MRNRLLAAATAVLALAGCSHDPAAHAPSPADARAVFDQYVQDNDLTKYAPLNKLHESATAICGMYDHGGTFADVISTLLNNGWTAGDAGKLNGASVADYCPQYKDKAG